jgi:iron(III) transport system permease protein
VALYGTPSTRQEKLGWTAARPRAFSEAVDRFLASNWLPMVVAWPVLVLVVLLTLFVLYMTFVPELPTEPGFTLDHWARLGDPYLYTKVLPNTVIVGFGTVLVTLAFGAPMAWLLNRTTMPFRALFISAIAIVAIIPGFVKAMGWLLLFQGRGGLGNRLLMDSFGLTAPPIEISNAFGMAWIMGLTLTPTLFFLVAGPIQALDPSFEEAASVAGAGRLRSFLRISLPLVWPATLGGAIYTFMTAISIFEIPALLGGAGGQAPVLATELFYAVNPPSASAAPAHGAAGVYGAMIALPSLLALYFYLRVIAQSHRYETITGRGYRPQRLNLGRFTWLAVAFVSFYLLLAVVLPMLVLVWVSLLPVIRLPSAEALRVLTLENYRSLGAMVGDDQVIWNTISLVAWTSLLTLFFSFAVSWIVVRTRFRLRGTMDVLAMLPHAIPGLAFAFALAMIAIVAARWAPFVPLRDTIGIIVMANLISRLAYGTRITNAALLQVKPDLEECARLCGARSTATMWRIIVPLVKPSLLYAGLWTAMLTFREVSMALMLQEANNAVLATQLWVLWRQGHSASASALAVVMIVVLAGLVLLTQVLAGRSGEARRPPTQA